MSVIRSTVLALLGASATFGALAACRSAVNLDVAYRDAASVDGSDDGGEGGVPPGVELEGCPCDESAGFGCCVTTKGASFCTTDLGQCQAELGVFMKCFRPDPNTESECCWHPPTGSNAPIGSIGSQAAYAGYCDAGPPACTTNSDCRNYAPAQRTCVLTPCGNQQIGACGAAPACP